MPDKENVDLFEKVPVAKAVLTLAIPTVISQLITTFYNLADTFFVGQLNDPDQVAAIALVLPVQLSLTALGNLFGVGGGTLFSNALGRRDIPMAKKISAFAFYGALAAMLAYATVATLFREPFLILLGSTEALRPYTGAYVFWVLTLGGTPATFNLVAAHFIRAEGASKAASFGLSMGGVLNIILDPFFIFPFGLGLELRGAAAATFLSNCVTSAYFIFYQWKMRRRTVISLSPRHFSLEKEASLGVLQIGLPSALQMLLSTASNMVLNHVVVGFGGAAVAGVGICKKVEGIPAYTLLGTAQGVVPLLAYNYGAKNQERLEKSVRCTAFAMIGTSVFFLLAFQLLARPIASLFIKVPQTVDYAAVFIRIHCVSMPFAAVGFLLMGYFQAVKKTRQATLLSLIRKGIFDVPLMFALNAVIPLYGPVMCQAIMDATAALCALAMYRRLRRGGRGPALCPLKGRLPASAPPFSVTLPPSGGGRCAANNP